ncbi:hypothetical protein IO408_001437 [Campylobacter lari]|nr:hypothetical protein [Campylobacter lari]
MKAIQTNKVNSFENWRINNINLYGNFIWPQINYNVENADIISIIFEEKNNINNALDCILCKIQNLPYFVLNFQDSKSKYYTNGYDLKAKIGLRLYKEFKGSCNSYWQYRLQTKPQNCLTADIDSLEVSNNGKFIGIEAAYLFCTDSIDLAIPNIFNTFKFRVNQVNEKQYLSQYKLMRLLHGESFILFHMINKEDNSVNTSNNVLLLKNDNSFCDMLVAIKYLEKNKFIEKYREYFKKNIFVFKNIYEAYDYIKNL